MDDYEECESHQIPFVHTTWGAWIIHTRRDEAARTEWWVNRYDWLPEDIEQVRIAAEVQTDGVLTCSKYISGAVISTEGIEPVEFITTRLKQWI